MAKKRGARQGSTRFYAGRTTHTSSEQKKLKKQKEYRRSKLSKQKRQEMLVRVGYKLRWVGVILILVVAFNLSQIKNYSFTGLGGLTAADRSAIESITDEYVGGLNRFKFFFDESSYEAELLEQASFIRKAEASTGLFSTTLSVRVFPKTPVHSYEGNPLNDRQWIAEDGSLIELTDAQISDLGTTRPTTYIRDTSGVEYEPGSFVVPVSTLDFMRSLAIELELGDAVVKGFVVGDNPREISVGLAGEKYKLLVSVDRPVESIITDLAAAQESIKQRNVVVNEYIDLTVPDKVFYR